MRVETVSASTADDSTHVIRWSDVDGDDHEQVIEGERAAVEAWNALHEGTVDPRRKVHAMTWSERVRLVDEQGNDLGVEERQRAHFSHGFDALGVYNETGAPPPAG